MAEFDELGRDGFLAKYGFRRAQRYFLRDGEKLYDSKAIVGAAVGYQHPDKGTLPHTAFSGGEETVQAKLLELGFDVVGGSTPSDAIELDRAEVDAFATQVTTTEYAKGKGRRVTDRDGNGWTFLSTHTQVLLYLV